MRILYIAKHSQVNSNDDEGAIKHAFEKIGHTVICLQEDRMSTDVLKFDANLCLFHKWDDVNALHLLKGKMARVFWYFDLVDYPDSSLESRNRTRREWMERIVPNVEVGFCTDGNWVSRVNRDGKGKLVWLMQGADERVAIPQGNARQVYDILFTGISARGGVERVQFVNEMGQRYGGRFKHVTNGVHGEELARLIADSRIVVAPCSPVMSSYWSNRVYLTLGFRACMLHPRCDRLMDHYQDEEEILFYDSMNDLHQKIEYLLSNGCRSGTRQRIAENGYMRTMKEHTYRHRVMRLLDTLKERGLV